jgi:hypothetical protein
VFNFQPGDIIQQEYDEQSYSPDSAGITSYIEDSFINKTYLSGNTAVQYVFNRKFVKTITPAPVGFLASMIEKLDTIVYNNLDSLPTTNLGRSLCNQVVSSTSISADPSQCNDSVWTQIYGQPYICGQNYVCYTQILFYMGLGGPYYNSTSAVTNVDKHLNIIFYKKGNKTCGQRLTLWKYTGVNDLEGAASSGIKIYPNPSNGNFTIEKLSNDATDFSLYNLVGQKILTQQLNAQKTLVANSNLIKGVYLYSINTLSNTNQKWGKLIVE